MTEVALFPIPNLISFPGTLIPLHVFEPRYRTMIKESVKLGRLVGVAHTKKVLSKVNDTQTLGEKLNKNQDTYEPQSVFSAGLCEIKDVTADGRMMVEVKMSGRYKFKETVQNLPYQTVLCDLYEDEEELEEESLSLSLKSKLDQFLIEQAGAEEKDLKNLLLSEAWQELPIENYSFSVFQLIKFAPSEQQMILEMRSSCARLKKACALLNLI